MIVARCETYVSAVCALSFHVSAHLCDVRPARRRTADGSCTAPRAGRCDISSSVVRLPWILQQHPRSSRPPPRKPAPPVPSLALLALAQALAACPPKTSSVLPLAQSSRSRLPRTRDASSESPPPPPPSPFRPPKPVRLFMGVALQRRTVLVAGALAGVLGLTLLVSHASSAGSAAQAAGSSSSSPKWWDHLGVDIPSWSTGVGSAYAGAPVVCPEHADAGVPTLANAFVPIDDGAGRFVGKETRYLRGVPGYCELPRSLPRSPWPGSRARADPDLSLAALFENVYTMGGLMGAFDSRSSQNSSQLAGSSPRPPSPPSPRLHAVAVTSDPGSLPPVTKVMSDMSRGTPENPFPVADETRWLVLSPDEAAKRLVGRQVRARPVASILTLRKASLLTRSSLAFALARLLAWSAPPSSSTTGRVRKATLVRARARSPLQHSSCRDPC